MKIQLQRNPVFEKLPENALYVPQDNYAVVTPGYKTKWKYLYCDSATSCIIVIVAGKCHPHILRLGKAVAISHLSRPERFNAFFEQINQKLFIENISIFAHGANPPEPGKNHDGKPDYTALRNANIVNKWVLEHSETREGALFPQIKQATLLFGEGNPGKEENNLDCYGINISDPDNLVVSNRRFDLKPEDRDPTGGLQTLFCVFGLKALDANNTIRLAENPFTESDKNKLLIAAHAAQWEQYEKMSDDEILKKCSSTPHAEVPWFCDTIRESALYVRLNYKL